MPKVRIVNINAAAGGYTDISATIPCRRMEVIEDDSVTAVGLNFKTYEDNFATVKNVAPGHEPIVLGNVVAHGNNAGPVLGWPAQTTGGDSIAATKLISIESRTAGTTKVRVTEFE